MKYNHFLVSIVLSMSLVGCLETGEKHEWSILQIHEYQNRDLDLSQGTVVKMHGDYCIAGFVSTTGERQRIWVLMNPKFAPYFKTMPDDPISITRAEYDVLPIKCQSDGRVKSKLVHL